jgi:hypothetical protein
MGTNTEHDQPLGSLNTVVVLLRVTKGLDVDLVGIGNLVGGSVTDKDRLSIKGARTMFERGIPSATAPVSWSTPPIPSITHPRHLTIKFFPSGIALISTSTFAKAKTSALAAILLKISLTVDFAPEAASKPMDPTIKYWRERLVLGDLAR